MQTLRPLEKPRKSGHPEGQDCSIFAKRKTRKRPPASSGTRGAVFMGFVHPEEPLREYNQSECSEHSSGRLGREESVTKGCDIGTYGDHDASKANRDWLFTVSRLAQQD